ncbi:MAG: hypothetical protein ACPG46_00420 [Thalassotalea sp.]
MALFSWYMNTDHQNGQKDKANNSSHTDSMWPIAKVRKSTQFQQPSYSADNIKDSNELPNSLTIFNHNKTS